MGQSWLRMVVVIFRTLFVLEAASWSHGCWDQDRIALFQLKSFFALYPGDEVSICCQWKSVECNITTGRITKLSIVYAKYLNLFNASLFLPFEELRTLDLSYVGLVGCVKNEGFEKLSKLKHLEILDLTDNYFDDSTLSSVSNISTLKSLSLGLNDLFTGSNHTSKDLKWLSRLTSLEVLDLNRNDMKNNFLLHLGGLSSLKTLILWGNSLEGTVHLQDLYNLTNLKELDLSDNRMESIRCSHGNGKQLSLIKLEKIDLSYNLFNNSILTELNEFSNLKSLNLRQNQLNGSINVKEFCGLSNLETLSLSDNEVNQFETSKEKRCLGKLKFLYLNGVSTKGSISFVSLLEPFPSVKTLSLGRNSYLNKTVAIQELHVLSNVENLILDNTPLDISFLENIGILTSLKTLSLYNCSLAPKLPAREGLCYLNSLEELNLNGNALGGPIASCLGNLTSLRYLDISNNQFTGNVASSPLTDLTMLQFLSLSKNQFQVPVSFKSFSNHSNLKFLSSKENKLVVEPAASQTWSPKFQLKVFILSNCTIDEHGKLQLPYFLYFQHDLRYVDLSYCNFGGISFPNWLVENNTGLQELYMIESSIVGPLFLPTHPNPNLVAFEASNNNIQHEIPRNFCSLLPNLEVLSMSRNGFKSNIPLCLGSLRKLSYLDLSHNKFFGGIPKELAMSNSLSHLRLSNNTLRGKIFPAIYYLTNSLLELYLDINKFEGEIPDFSAVSSVSLSELDVSDNHLSGKLPRWLWNKTNLIILDLSKNRFEGSIPMELCNLVILQFLDLSQNHLSGTLPSCSNLQNVQHVHLSKNMLSGPLSHAFSGSFSLVTLDLSENNLIGKIPNWISMLPHLSVLLLKANKFHGEFPSHLCKMSSLSILDLSQNKLSGSIPSCLSNFTLEPRRNKSDIVTLAIGFRFLFFYDILADMGFTIYDLPGNKVYYARELPGPHVFLFSYAEEVIEFSTKSAAYAYKGNILAHLSGIDLSCNQLTGIIPPELGNMSEIHALNLSHNNLTGPIPSTFSKLKQIESLDLSYNNLNGSIPSQLTELNFLEVFTVAHNNLSGPLPDWKAQFGTFDESSYEGNPLLCGLPLKNSCNEGDSVWTPSASSCEEEHGFIEMGDFCISFAVSYAIMLLATVIVLHINSYRRQAWFYLVEDISTTCYFFIVDRLRRLPGFRRNV